MANVVGLTVWMKLKQQNTVVFGKVKDLAPNEYITLENVVFPGTGTRWDHWTVQATAIENLEVVDPSIVPALAPTPTPSLQTAQTSFPPTRNTSTMQQPSAPPLGMQSTLPHSPMPHFGQQPVPALASGVVYEESRVRQTPGPAELPASAQAAVPGASPQRQTSAFVDPAIISMGNASQTGRTPKPSQTETPIKSMLARAAAASLPSPGSPFIADAGTTAFTQKLKDAAKQMDAIQTIPRVNKDGLLESGSKDRQQEVSTKKKVRRGQKPKKQTANEQETNDPPAILNTEVSRHGNDMNGSVKRGKGWRSTPLLQPSPASTSPMDKSQAKDNKRKQKQNKDQDQMGDTTDIADMGDFDFESELKKFDKKQVFDEIRQGDTTADEDRLVSHNRARPGTHGGKNLHPTEPVLSPKVQPIYNSNELESTSDADTELNLVNGRSSSKHSLSRKALPKTKPSRQNSTQIETKPHPLSASTISDRNRNRSTTSLTGRAKSGSLAASSPYPDRTNSPSSAISTRKMADSIAALPSKSAEPYFAISSHEAPCPTLLPRALENLEAAAISTFGMTDQAITENAARCIAEAALQLSDLQSGMRRPSRTNTMRGSTASGAPPNRSSDTQTVVVLAGNHEIGARSLAAARQLLGRNVKVIAAESLYESADTQDSQAKAQTAILRKMARGGANIKRGLWSKASRHIKNLSGPPAVIIDALLAGSTYASLLSSNATYSTAAQQETREMIEWANRSRAPVLSIGCPSGISGVDGISTIVDGEPLAVRPDKVLALGAPMSGLLKALESGAYREVWDICVADIGINIALKSDEAVSFGGQWVVDLHYVNGDAV